MPTHPSRQYHHGALREALLAAATALLEEQGLEALTLRAVAKRAGVSHAAPYHHFSSLDEMLAAISAAGFVALGDAVERAGAGCAPYERILAISEAYVLTALADAPRYRLMFGPLLARQGEFPDLASASARALAGLRSAACAWDPEQGEELALMGWSLVHGLSNLLIDGVLTPLSASEVLADQPRPSGRAQATQNVAPTKVRPGKATRPEEPPGKRKAANRLAGATARQMTARMLGNGSRKGL